MQAGPLIQSETSVHPINREWNTGIDLLRFSSALLVAMSHYRLLPANFMWSGVHGVCIFFIVSGYCMGFSVQGRSASEFLGARYTRLLPAFLFAVLFTSAVEYLLPEAAPDRGQTFKSTVANIICLPFGNVICDLGMTAMKGAPVTYSFVDGAYWSLLVEFRFYLLLTICYFALGLSKSWIAIFLSALSLLAILQPFGEPEYISKSSDFFMYLPFFAFGLAYRLYQDGKSILLLLVPLAAFAALVMGATTSVSMRLHPQNAMSFLLCFMAFAVMMHFKFQPSARLKLLGAVSYPFYLLHQDLGEVISGSLHIAPIFLILIKLFAMLTLALVVHKYIEAPAHTFIKRIKETIFHKRLATLSNQRINN